MYVNKRNFSRLLETKNQIDMLKTENTHILTEIKNAFKDFSTGTTIKDTWTKSWGRVEVGEGGGLGWGGVEG